jgi:hypothetical protein
MLRHRKLLVLSVVFIVVVAAGVVVYQRVARPARAVLLVPEGDLVIFADLAPLPFVKLGDFVDVEQLPGQSDPGYQDFRRQTNFHVERDLKTVAISIRNPGDANSEYAAVLTGKFDQSALRAYMQAHSTGTEEYAGKTIFFIRDADHILRACLVDTSTVAVSDMQSADGIHNVIDRARGAYLVTSGGALVHDHYRDVPFGSVVWAIFRPPVNASGAQLPGGSSLDFLQDSVTVISVRYTGSIRLKAEVISASENQAAQVLEAANTLRALASGASDSLSPGGTDKDVKAVFDNIEVQKTGSRTVLSVVIPQAFIQKMAARMKQ